MMKIFLKQNRGYTLLFAVLASTMILSIAAFILSVSRKQLILASTARDSTYAIYAADSGIECAAKNIDELSTSTTLTSVSCGDITANLSRTSDTLTFHFPIDTGSSPTSCVSVAVRHSYEKDSANNPHYYRRIEARGYNLGWNQSQGNCSTYGPRKVERALKLTYDLPLY